MADRILITGANRGIGLEMTRQAAAAGHQVTAACRKPDKADELNALAADSGGRLIHNLVSPRCAPKTTSHVRSAFACAKRPPVCSCHRYRH